MTYYEDHNFSQLGPDSWNVGDVIVDTLTVDKFYIILKKLKNRKYSYYCYNIETNNTTTIDADRHFKKVVFVDDGYITTVVSTLKEDKHEV